MWSWIKKHKAVTVIAVLAVAGVGAFLYLRHAAEEALAAMSELAEETAFVERRSIESSISSTGKIISDSTRTITTTLTGVEVATVDVEVGDVLAIGDVICTFDTDDLSESLTEAEDILSAAERQSDLTVNNARRALEMAQETHNYQLENASRGIISAYNTLCAAQQNYQLTSGRLSDAQSGLSSANAAYTAAFNAYKEQAAGNTSDYELEDAAAELSDAEAELSAAREQLEAAMLALTAATAGPSLNSEPQLYTEPSLYPEQQEPELQPEPESLTWAQTTDTDAAQLAVDEAQAAVDAAQARLDDARVWLDSAKSSAMQTSSSSDAELKKEFDQTLMGMELNAAITSAKSGVSTAEQAVVTAQSNLRSAQLGYDKALSDYDYAVANYSSQFEGSEDAYGSARASAGVATITQQNNVENLEKQVGKRVLTASIAGTVTAVNVEEGDMYAGGAVVTIQDTGAMVVSAEIDEYDIADVRLGMRTVFKTDATRDELLEGEVIFIAPTPTVGSDVTYQIKAAIHSDTTRLRLGMNAKLNIILEETDDVLTVPYDAVQKDDSGADVVYTVERSEDGTVTRTAIPVTVGVEGDYYVEIEGALNEGAEVELPSAGDNDLMAMMLEMGGGM